MELRHIYSLSKILGDALDTDEMVGASSDDIELHIKLTHGTLYSIDQEFYRQTHNGSLEGFEHNKEINAIIDNVRFVLTEKEMSSD